MAAARTSVTKTTNWTVAMGPTSGGDKAYFWRLNNPQPANLNELSTPEYYTFNSVPWLSKLSEDGNDDQRQRIVVDLSGDESNQILLKFFGTPQSTPALANKARVGMGAVWGVGELANGTDTEYLGEFLGRFELTMGAEAATGSNVVPSDAIFGRRCTVVADRSMFPGFRAVGEYPLSQGSGGSEALVAPSPVLAVDALGYTAIIVELRGQFPLGSAKSATATKLGFAYRTL